MGASEDGTSSLSSSMSGPSPPSSPEKPSGRMVKARVGARESIRCCRPDGDCRRPVGGPPLAIPGGEALLLPLMLRLRSGGVAAEVVTGQCGRDGGASWGRRESKASSPALRGGARRQWWCRVWSALFRFTALAALAAFRPGQAAMPDWGSKELANTASDVWDSVQ